MGIFDVIELLLHVRREGHIHDPGEVLDEVLGHVRRYEQEELSERLVDSGFRIEEQFSFNRITVPGWFINGRVLRRQRFGKIQLKIFDSTIWLWRRLDRILPWKGISLIANRPEALRRGS